MWSLRLVDRRIKALTLMPFAIVVGASAASHGSPAHALQRAPIPLPGGGFVPSQAIEAPASLPVAGELAPALPAAPTDSVGRGSATGGIPAPALAAYQRSAQIVDGSDPTCSIPWELIAAIGRVESDHGRYGGNSLDAQGNAVPGIYGPQLNGQAGTQVVRDTDGGSLDRDAVYDRAVGPMQFLPSTWRAIQVGGDGVRNPQNINDAALGTAIYLCSGRGNLSSTPSQQAAVFRYNHSQAYVDTVLGIMAAYAAGDYSSVASGAGGAVPEASSPVVARVPAEQSGSTSASRTSAGTSAPPNPTAPRSGGSPPAAIPSSASGPAPTPTPVLSLVLTPSTDALTSAQALSLCTSQFAAIPDPLGLLAPLKAQCANKIAGMTSAQAATAMPNTLVGLLTWLRS